MAEAWLAALSGSGLATADMAPDLALLRSPKDDDEVKNVKKAAYLVSNALLKFTVPQLEGESAHPVGWCAAAYWWGGDLALVARAEAAGTLACHPKEIESAW